MPPVPPEAVADLVGRSGFRGDQLVGCVHPLAVPAGHRAGYRAVAVRWRARSLSALAASAVAVFDPAYSPTVAVVVPGLQRGKGNRADDRLPAGLRPSRDSRSSSSTTVPATPLIAVAREAFADDPRVRVSPRPTVASRPRSTSGLARTHAEIVVALDADTVVHPRHHQSSWSAISPTRTSVPSPATPRSAIASICSPAGRRWSTSPARIWTGAPSTSSTASPWCRARWVPGGANWSKGRVVLPT
jgi:hypothetical protein